MIKAVVFDLDNTVYDYDACNERAMEKLKAFACDKYHISSEQFISEFDKAKHIVKKQLGDTGSSHNRMLYMQVFLEQIGRKPSEGALELYDMYWDTMLENMELYPYVLPLMEELRNRGITIAVLTDLTAHIQHRKIKKLGLAEYVEVMVTSEEAGQEKPSKIAFELVLKKLYEKAKVKPEETMMIGDSKKKDVEGAITSGMKAILYQSEENCSMDKICLDCIEKFV
jgi:putative hydrolase of the HAD superfamily